jgi:hypothetical protein
LKLAAREKRNEMNDGELKIINAFISRYFVSAARAGGMEKNTLRLQAASLFPDFDSALPDEKESWLEAAEELERKGLLILKWEKRSKGERLKTLNCPDIGKLFEESGRKSPKAEAEKIRALFKDKIRDLPRNYHPFLNYLSQHFSPAEIGRGMDLEAAGDLVRLLEVFTSTKPANLTTRALSISLYRDSKRLEHLLDLFNPLLSQVQKQESPARPPAETGHDRPCPPDLSFLRRSFPETMISGKIIFEYGDNSGPPLVNANGLILGFPLQSILKIGTIKTIHAKDAPAVLTIENLETFYVLGDPDKFGQDIDVFLYVGGYLNQAAAAMIKILSASGFLFFHAGDLDPDGILILQNVRDIAEKPVSPIAMNAAVFDRYLPWARPLTGNMLDQTRKIREDTKTIPGLEDLIRRIVETGRGVEQEIIDYRGEGKFSPAG